MTIRQTLFRQDVLALTGPSKANSSKPVDAGTAKLVTAAKEFEAMMLGELMKPLRFGCGVDEGMEDSSGGASGTIQTMASESLAKSLAEHGGVGIASKIVSQVEAEHQAATKKRGGTKVA